MAGWRRRRWLGGVPPVGAASPGEPSELTDEREALPARPHLLHLLPGFSPHEQGERAGGRDCAWAASRAVHVTEAAPGCLVRMGTARKPTLSPLPRNFVSDLEDCLQEEDVAARAQSLGLHRQHSLTLSTLGRWRQEDAGFKVILSYLASLRPAWVT